MIGISCIQCLVAPHPVEILTSRTCCRYKLRCPTRGPSINFGAGPGRGRKSPLSPDITIVYFSRDSRVAAALAAQQLVEPVIRGRRGKTQRTPGPKAGAESVLVHASSGQAKRHVLGCELLLSNGLCAVVPVCSPIPSKMAHASSDRGTASESHTQTRGRTALQTRTSRHCARLKPKLPMQDKGLHPTAAAPSRDLR